METKTGGCHCKKVRYEVKIDLTQPVIECNCSYCEAKGLLLAFVPGTSFRITEGEHEMTEYRFNTNKIEHLFCTTCGIQAFGRGKDKEGNATAAINVRTVDNIDLGALTRTPYNGKDM